MLMFSLQACVAAAFVTISWNNKPQIYLLASFHTDTTEDNEMAPLAY